MNQESLKAQWKKFKSLPLTNPGIAIALSRFFTISLIIVGIYAFDLMNLQKDGRAIKIALNCLTVVLIKSYASSKWLQIAKKEQEQQ